MFAPLTCIVPCRDAQAYLGEAIASAVDEGADEVVVVDDGSTDDSAAIAAAAVGPVRLVRQTRQGAAAARNAGLAAAQHDLIGFLDADDLWPPGSLAARRRALDLDPRLDAVYGHTRQFHSPELDAATRSRVPCPSGTFPAPTFGSTLFRRSVFERIGAFNSSLQVGEMFEFMARFADAGLTVRCVPDTVLLRRIHASNMMRPGAAAATGYPRALKAVLDRRRRMRAGI
ncbi:MAG TPA: glycosyltransferase family A protein [Xanthobacteraceae bacterium]|jgi:glycosyltransferase involved in cell wall biosynthesis|nr:glycosyltransferase family A protein [Xanthobacteraceae bacterium]